MNFVWLPRRSDGLQRVTSSLRVASLAGMLVMLSGALPAAAQSEVKSAVDGAGTAINNQLGELFGVKKPPPPKRRAKPAKPVAAKPPAAAKPAEAKPVQAKPVEAKGADTKPAEAKPAETRPTVMTAPPAEPPKAAAPMPPVVETKPAAAPKTAAVPLPPARPFDGTPKAAPVTSEPITPLAVTPIPVKPTPMAKPAPMSAPTPLTPQRTAIANVPLPPRPPIARPSAPRLAALPAPEPSAQAVPVPPARAPAADAKRADTKTAALPPADEAEADEPAKGAAPSEPAIATICPELSNESLAVFTPIQISATQAACTVDRGVSMSAVKMRDGRMVKLEPAAVLRCEMAASVANWLRDKVDPAVATLGSPLEVVMVAASQQCRPRNRVKGAKISEHGRGNALDTRGYVLEDGRKFVIGRDTKDAKAMPQAFQEALKASACADFTTILGPGSDGYHEEHLHVDRAVRRSTVAMCQWTIGRGGGN